MTTHADRAARPLRWYPRAWRARYGDEFAELLAADLADRPRSARRTADVAAGGLRARLADAGLSAHPLDHRTAARAGLATAASCGAAFSIGGLAMWSQIAIGAQWARPRHQGVTWALDLMSVALLGLALIALPAIAGLTIATMDAIRRGCGRELRGPAAVMLAAAAVLFFGARHFQNGWPGTGGHLLLTQAHIPAWLAAFCWAAIMWMTSYLAHPAALAAFPPGQLAWMACGAIASFALVGGAGQFLRRLDQSPAGLRYATWLGRAASACMLLFIAGAARWLVSPGTGVLPAFHVGSIDRASMVLLAASLMLSGRALRGTTRARLALARTGAR
jgi:hypothetical protein